MTDAIILTPEEFAWFVKQASAAPPPNARLERALRDLAELSTEGTEGAVIIDWRPKSKE